MSIYFLNDTLQIVLELRPIEHRRDLQSFFLLFLTVLCTTYANCKLAADILYFFIFFILIISKCCMVMKGLKLQSHPFGFAILFRREEVSFLKVCSQFIHIYMYSEVHTPPRQKKWLHTPVGQNPLLGHLNATRTRVLSRSVSHTLHALSHY